jgi:hypothetical protein
LKPAADICFELGDDSTKPFRSLVAPLCLAQALVVSIGQQLPANAPAVRQSRRPSAGSTARAAANRKHAGDDGRKRANGDARPSGRTKVGRG